MHKFSMILEEKSWTENFTDFHSNKQNDVKLLEGRTKGKSKLVMYVQYSDSSSWYVCLNVWNLCASLKQPQQAYSFTHKNSPILSLSAYVSVCVGGKICFVQKQRGNGEWHTDYFYSSLLLDYM